MELNHFRRSCRHVNFSYFHHRNCATAPLVVVDDAAVVVVAVRLLLSVNSFANLKHSHLSSELVLDVVDCVQWNGLAVELAMLMFLKIDIFGFFFIRNRYYFKYTLCQNIDKLISKLSNDLYFLIEIIIIWYSLYNTHLNFHCQPIEWFVDVGVALALVQVVDFVVGRTSVVKTYFLNVISNSTAL